MYVCVRGARSNRTKALRLKRKNEKREKLSSIGKTAQMPWRRNTMLQKLVQQFTNSRLKDIKAEKCEPRLITSVNSFYACRRIKRTSSSPSTRVPSSLTKFSPEEHTACVMRQTITWSRTPGMRPDYNDFMPSAKLLCSSSPSCY